jgi:uncharacterized membrane protein
LTDKALLGLVDFRFTMTKYDIHLYLGLFFIYSFLGWCTEVIFCSVNTGQFVNRGFLNGPICPIYGFGMIMLIFALENIADNVFLLFIGSGILCSAWELLAGWILKKVFHTSWWDYSDIPFNIGGYICLKFSLLWGLAGVVAIRVIHPLALRFVNAIPQNFNLWILAFCSLLIVGDTLATANTVIGLNKDLRLVKAQAERLGTISEDLSEAIGSKRIDDAHRLEKLKGEAEEKLSQMKENLYTHSHSARERLFKAFPDMKHTQMNDILEETKEKYDDSNSE